MNEQKTILIVEDDEVDVMTIKRAMKEIHVTNPVEVRWNGEEALVYLQGEKELPGIVLLDLNMPRMNGMEFLQHVRSDERLKRIPVVVLTTSREEQDRTRAPAHTEVTSSRRAGRSSHRSALVRTMTGTAPLPQATER